jgi:hypothetical protein
MEDQLSKRFIAMLVSALTIVALVAGCGGGSDSGDSSAADTSSQDKSTAPALSKAEFIKQGDEICTKTAEELNEGIESYTSENELDEGEEPSEEQQEALVSEAILPVFRAQAEQLGALGPPTGEEAAVEEIVTGIEDAVADAEDDLSSAISGESPLEDANAKAREFGFKVCGQEG